MKMTSHVEKWGSGVLGAVSLVLLVNLVWKFNGVRAGGTHADASLASAVSKGLTREKSKAGDDLSKYDSLVRLDLLKELQARPLPELARNPFEFEAAPVAPGRLAAGAAAAGTPAAQPPPPPPIPLTAMGYAEKAGGVHEAYVADETDVYAVHEGDVVANRYKILRITPATVSIEDEVSHQSGELPVPQ